MAKKESGRPAKLAGLALGAALPVASRRERKSPPSDGQAETISELVARFEAAALLDEAGVEFWYARELQRLLGYVDYRNFSAITQRAMDACRNADQEVAHHFVEVNEMVEIGSGAGREISDFKLTRYACYLIAQNGDARKKPVACAQVAKRLKVSNQASLAVDDNHKIAES